MTGRTPRAAGAPEPTSAALEGTLALGMALMRPRQVLAGSTRLASLPFLGGWRRRAALGLVSAGWSSPMPWSLGLSPELAGWMAAWLEQLDTAQGAPAPAPAVAPEAEREESASPELASVMPGFAPPPSVGRSLAAGSWAQGLGGQRGVVRGTAAAGLPDVAMPATPGGQTGRQAAPVSSQEALARAPGMLPPSEAPEARASTVAPERFSPSAPLSGSSAFPVTLPPRLLQALSQPGFLGEPARPGIPAVSATRGPLEEAPTREGRPDAEVSQAGDSSSPLPVWSALPVGRGMAQLGTRAFAPPPLPGSLGAQPALAMASLGLAASEEGGGAEASALSRGPGEPVLPSLSPRATSKAAAALTLPSAPVLAEAIHRIVEESVSQAVEHMARRAPPASPPEPPAAPPVDVTSDAFVRGLLGRLRALLQEERFRDGLIR